jgi:hypothetical protein
MSHVKSIICFNGGSGGDFLKAICLTQFNYLSFSVEDNGMMEFNHHYFKETCELCYKNLVDWTAIDPSQILPVENTHYYFEWFNNISSAIYYINYPDSMTDAIIKTYVDKRFQGNNDKFIELSLAKLPYDLQQIIPKSNALSAIGKTWIKNQQIWRNNPNMHAIELVDIFELAKLKTVVSKIVQKELIELDYLEQLHSTWTEKNQNLFQACL